MNKRERVEKYGSFLYCPKKDTLCSIMDTDHGECTKKLCYRDDPEYLRKEREREKKIQENARVEALHKTEKKREKTKEEKLLEEIAEKEKLARSLYKQNNPKAADYIMMEVMMLTNRLRIIKENKNDQ